MSLLSSRLSRYSRQHLFSSATLRQRRRCFSTKKQHVPIVIIGGGPSGLLLSNLLSSCGTPSLLLEARSEADLFTHPQAHFLNTRTMEILRHSLPDLHQHTREAMPPVEEWRYFSFGHSTSPSSEMARVAHPVDQPLDAFSVDANGILLEKGELQATTSSPPPSHPLSVCSVGHLAQHTFSKLLYESAMELKLPESNLQLNSPIVNIEWQPSDRVYKLTTQSGDIVYAPIVVAADGSNSRIRQAWKIDMRGQEGIQHLMNVHIRTTSLTVDTNPAAMLYAIYNEDCVAMMVRHSAGEYVLQIPYFPPYQTMERDFTMEKVHKMVSKIMNSETGIDIVSIRPWTMSSLIASSYVDPASNAGVLVGDAAHVFPPAGGFGMNTGLQDVHNLAWRLTAICKNREDDNNKRSESVSGLLQQHLQDYQVERQAIARQNAALSVRNFTRVLQLAKSCYLDDQHPTLLIRLLDALSWLPLSVRQDMFGALLRTALAPLASLKWQDQDGRSSWHAKHITSNLRSILQRGGGLPLLFPKYELGFSYGAEDEAEGSNTEKDCWKDDTLGYDPKVEVGRLLPHVTVEVVSASSSLYPNLQWISDSRTITTSDLPSQMRMNDPCFVLLVVGHHEGQDDDQLWKKRTEKIASSNLPLESKMARVVTERPKNAPSGDDTLVLLDESGQLQSMTKGIVVLRPDGHIWAIEAVGT
jgi:2-polyprenyl-6-methoxyphenol hydroxylase-like FAD-dependent oxidoreductase